MDYMLKKVLIVEDETDLVRLLKYNLEKEGFKVNYATDGAVALAEARRDPPDLVILDLMLPGLDGLEVGGDDYVTKPFSTREVIARVRALLRRNEPVPLERSKVERGDLVIDPTAHSVSVEGRTVELSALEF